MRKNRNPVWAFSCLLFLFITSGSVFAVQYEFYDMFGSSFIYGEKLLYLQNTYKEQESQAQGSSLIGMQDGSWIKDFWSHIVIYDNYNDLRNMIELGRTPTVFSPLTLQKTLFQPSYLYYEQQGFKMESQIPSPLKKATFLFTRTDFQYYNQIDWKWEENNGKDLNGSDLDKLFTAGRLEFDLTKKLQLGVSYVNEHTTLHGFSGNPYSDPFAGSTRSSLVKKINIRFSDASPDDGSGGAAIFSIKAYVNGIYQPSLSFNNNTAGAACTVYSPNPVGNHQEANGTKKVDFGFDLGGFTGINDVDFVIDVANDYLISYGTDQNQDGHVDDYDGYMVIYNAEGNVQNYANRKEISWTYGEITGKSIYGMDLKGEILGFFLTGEMALLADFYRMPGNDGKKYPVQFSPAWYVKIKKDLDFLEAGAEVFNISPYYYADFAVEDNDDKDAYPDITDNPAIADGGDGINFKTSDKNNNGILDCEENFLLFDNDPRYFRDGVDDNNNNIYDNEENDSLPDYPYKQGTAGFNCYLSASLFSGASLLFKNADVTSEMAGQYSRKSSLDAVYTGELTGKNRIFVRNQLAYISDTIPDDTIDQNNEIVKDPLQYPDNLVDTVLVRLSTDLLRHLVLENDFYFKYDICQLSGISTFDDKTKKTTISSIHRVRYNWIPVERLTVSPLAKINLLDSFQSAGGFRSANLAQTLRAAGLEVLYALTDKTKLMAGYQILGITEFNRRESNEFRNTYGMEMTHQSRYWNRMIGIKAGVMFSDHKYSGETLSRDYVTEDVYVNAFFKW